MEEWAEIRRLHKAEGMGVKTIVRRLGVARNTVRVGLAAEEPPWYRRKPAGSIVDGYEPQIRALLAQSPSMPGDGDRRADRHSVGAAGAGVAVPKTWLWDKGAGIG